MKCSYYGVMPHSRKKTLLTEATKQRIKMKEIESYNLLTLQYEKVLSILTDGLEISRQLDWNKLRKDEKFDEVNPEIELQEALDNLTVPTNQNNKLRITKPTLQRIPIKPIKTNLPPPQKDIYFEHIEVVKYVLNNLKQILKKRNNEKQVTEQFHIAYKLKKKIEKIQTLDDNLEVSESSMTKVYLGEIEEAQKKYNEDYEIWINLVHSANLEFDNKIKEWEKQVALIEGENQKLNLNFLAELENQNKIIKENDLKYQKDLEYYNCKVDNVFKKNEQDVIEWNLRKNEFYNNQELYNQHIDFIKKMYFQFDLNVVAEYSKLVLKSSTYPDFITKKFEVDYNPNNKILVVEYSLPSIELLPTLREVKLTKEGIKEIHITENQTQNNFETTLYNITLRTIHELFHTDEINALDAICFNGWVSTINKTNGNKENNCILSIQVKKEDFTKINLKLVDPKLCFKSFKGVSSSKLNTITSIQPIIKIDKKDKRFVESQNVTQNIDESTNLAAMDWEDFEHLIREIFEKEFSFNGGEVKVTQASRDGGVDAIAFDPDPIRGGKIVIQAKRYTNTVGVSAVRDLFGTVMNEGANKGILVTTSDYGHDSYEFAKGKPLTLLNGGNLLYLLEKHGHSARINIDEARKLMKG